MRPTAADAPLSGVTLQGVMFLLQPSPRAVEAPPATPELRVAMLIQGFAPVLGGAQRLVQGWAPLLERAGVDVTVVTRRWVPGTPVRERQPGLRLRRVPGSGAGPAGSLAWAAGATAATLAARPHVLHAHDPLSPTTIALLAARPLGAPVVVTVHSTGPGGDLSRPLARPLGLQRFRAAARRIAAFVCLTPDIAGELEELGVPAAKLRVIANGVDAERFRPAEAEERAALRASLGVADDELLHLFCGRLRDVKRLDVLLDALARVPGRLLLVGDGPEEERLRRRAQAPDLRGRVTFLPPTEDPAPLYRAADAYVSASHTEGMSISVLEAMATGLPVVATPASGMADLLSDGQGATARDTSAEALARVLADVGADPARRAALGAAARAKVRRDHSLQTNADQHLDLYREVQR